MTTVSSIFDMRQLSHFNQQRRPQVDIPVYVLTPIHRAVKFWFIYAGARETNPLKRPQMLRSEQLI